MNKLFLREALNSGYSLKNNFIIYNNYSVDLNFFLIEMNKLRFTNSIHDSLSIFTERLSQNGENFHKGEKDSIQFPKFKWFIVEN